MEANMEDLCDPVCVSLTHKELLLWVPSVLASLSHATQRVVIHTRAYICLYEDLKATG